MWVTCSLTYIWGKQLTEYFLILLGITMTWDAGQTEDRALTLHALLPWCLIITYDGMKTIDQNIVKNIKVSKAEFLIFLLHNPRVL